MDPAFYQRVDDDLADLGRQGPARSERVLLSGQGAWVTVRRGSDRAKLLNLCANDYLGLASDPRVAAAARSAIDAAGAGMASVRFICGTHELHKALEAEIADYLGHEDAVLFAAAFDANGGVFEPLLGSEDAVVSDSLNHASIIDGVRLSKARRYRYATNDLEDLERQLVGARKDGARTVMIATDGVFSMDGVVCDLAGVAGLAERHGALLLVDDCHATGLIGPKGRGVGALQGVADRVDLLTGTFGKALGGAMGGFIAGRRNVVELLRQRARPYLFSNALAPAVCGAALKAIEIARSEEGDALRSRLAANAARLRRRFEAAGFELRPGAHPIAPVMLGEARRARAMAEALMDLGVLVSGFAYPVVPKGQARIRTQVSAAHSLQDIDMAAAAFLRARDLCEAAA